MTTGVVPSPVRACVIRILDVLLQAGLMALAVVTALAYFPFFSDYMIPKFAAVHGLGGGLVAVWLARAALAGRIDLPRSPVLLPMALFTGISLLSLLSAVNRAAGVELLLTQVWWFLLYLVAASGLPGSRAVLRLAWVMVAAGVVVAVLGVLQYAGVHLIPLPKAYGDLPVSTLGNTNFVAHYLDLVIPLVAGLLLATRGRVPRLLLGLALAVTGAHLVVTQNRGGWIALSVALVVSLVRWRRRLPWRRMLLLALVAAALLSPLVELVLTSVRTSSGDTLRDRAGSLVGRSWERLVSSLDTSEFSVAQRRLIWADTVDLIADHPWLGVGPGNYEHHLPAYRTVTRHRQWKEIMGERTQVAYQAHDEYLETAAETGILGLGAFLWLLAALIWQTHRLTAAGPAGAVPTAALTEGCLAGLVASAVHALFSFNLQDPSSATHLWLLAGMAVALNRQPPVAEQEGGEGSAEPRRYWRLAAPVAGVVAIVVGAYLAVCGLVSDYHYFRGLRYHEVGQPNRATLAFEEAIRWRGYDFAYHHMLGLSHFKSGRLAQAEQALTRSLALHPNNARALRLLGRTFLLQGGRAAEAVTALRRSTQLAPLEVEGYTWLALAWRQDGEHDQAAETWKQALASTPDNPGLLVNLGSEYLQAGRASDAVAVLEQAARAHPGNPQILGYLGAAYLADRRLAEAETALLRAIELAPDQAEWRLDLAQVYERQGRVDLALSQVGQVTGRDPENGPARQLAARLAAKAERGR